MEKGIDVTIPTNPSSDIVDATFLEGSTYLKTKICAFIWESNKYKNRDEWSVGTWSYKTNFRQIELSGTTSDKANLPREGRKNRKRRRLNEAIPNN